ncbi:NACHT, LRR and PYD domains-containing protein 12-like [Xenia sp. Carnegie-2017]|uniref:NACHT, LRR and PYD domains-containing protein 12-like n=1 Tax=Xenia sp. Carnegie-2017 TaxID=2897299 RepID=UPI001F049EA3|nr:NACHT, LRR and PYD domains-containing protein 12-like [Xenia sp. Carnegie-2017]
MKENPLSNHKFLFSHNVTSFDCKNPKGDKSETLIWVVAIANVIVIILTTLELCYLAYLAFNDSYIMTEQEFCMVYVLRKRQSKWLEKLKRKFYTHKIFEIHEDFGDDANSWRNVEDVYVNVVMQAERQLRKSYPDTFERHEIFHCHLKIRNDAVKITRATQIFLPVQSKKDQSYPRTILVIGRPGIGKTMLTRKLMHEWKNNLDKFWTDKIVLLMRCRTFKEDDITIKEMLGDCDGYSVGQFAQIYDFVLLNPDKTVLIFDGFDELALDNERLRTDGSLCVNAKMPAFTLLSMLLEGRLLPGVTVSITSRPTAQRAFELLKFQRTVEILGFFEDQIKEYVFKFCRKDKSTARKIFDCIDSSLELRSLCYIPVNCYILCLTLKESFINNAEDIPKTITELYKRVVKILLWRHHPRCKSGSIPKPDRGYLIKPLPSELDDEIQKMKSLAKKGMEEGKLIFDETHLTGFENLVNCGLLHQIPDKRRNYFCFLHLTLQEFLAAWCVVDDWKNIGKFLDDRRADPKWHLVIEFVAGLVGDTKKENKRLNIDDVQMRYSVILTF